MAGGKNSNLFILLRSYALFRIKRHEGSYFSPTLFAQNPLQPTMLLIFLLGYQSHEEIGLEKKRHLLTIMCFCSCSSEGMLTLRAWVKIDFFNGIFFKRRQERDFLLLSES